MSLHAILMSYHWSLSSRMKFDHCKIKIKIFWTSYTKFVGCGNEGCDMAPSCGVFPEVLFPACLALRQQPSPGSWLKPGRHHGWIHRYTWVGEITNGHPQIINDKTRNSFFLLRIVFTAITFIWRTHIGVSILLFSLSCSKAQANQEKLIS